MEHPIESCIRRTFEIESPELERLAYFVLAHVLIDTRLIATGLFDQIATRGGLSLVEIQGLADKAAAGTFGTHLERVAGKIPDDCFRIADELNRARNGLFHWRRDRLDPQPSYRGQDVTSPSGFQACMDDVLTFIQTVPWRNP